MDARSGERRFVGRATEVAWLGERLRDAGDGRPCAVLLAGEAGVGKSRLVAELAVTAVDAGVRVVEGSCLPRGEAGPPYLPIVSILRSLAREVPPAALPAILGPGRGELARLVPEFAERTDRLPPVPGPADPTAQARLFELVAGALDRLARSTPVLLIVEDVHWADRSSRDLLDFLVRGLRDQRLLAILTVRTDDLAASDDLRTWTAEFVRLPRVERLDLGPLDRREVASLVREVLGRAADPHFVEGLAARANGNPFLVEELADAAGDAATDPVALPAHLRELLLARLVGLDDAAQAIVRAASAVGTQLDDSLLAEAIDVPEARLSAALREALERGVLVRVAGRRTGEGAVLVPGPGSGARPAGPRGADGPAYAFRHELLRDAIYGDLLPRERTRLHAAYGAALARRAAHDPASVAPSALAYHWDAAGELGPTLAAHVRAGREATRMFAFAEARAHYERALELWPHVAGAEDAAGLDHPELLERAADAAAFVGDYGAAVERIEQAIDLADGAAEPMRMGSLRERQRFLLWEAGDEAAAVAAVQEALRLIPAEPPSSERARVLAHAAGLDLMAGRPREARRGAEEAIRVARAATALPEEALALGVEGFAVATLGHVEEGVAAFHEGMRIARLIGSVDGLALGYTNLVSLLDRVGRTREALVTALEGYAEVSRSGLARTFGGFLLAHAGRLHMHLGEWDAAAEVLERGLELDPVPRAQLALWIQVARLEGARGRFDAADVAIAEAMARASLPGAGEHRAALLESRLEVAVWAERAHDARALVDEAIAIPTVGRVPDPTLAWIGALGLRIEADVAETARARRDEVAVGRAELGAESIVGWLLGWLPAAEPEVQERLARSIDARAAAIVALLRAEHARLQGRQDPASWASVVDAWARVGRPLPLAYARSRLGTALLASGDRVGARDALALARETALRLGAEPLLRHIDRVARVGRIEVTGGADAGAAGAAMTTGGGTAGVAVSEGSEAAGLTPREREVLRLLAAGWSNPEIGEALGISAKTASVHVSNVLGKLGVGSRVEAAVVAARIGLAPAPSDGAADAAGRGGGSRTGRRSRRTFLFTDIVGSTALVEAMGDDAWRDLRRWHDATLRALFERHGGREIDHAGDGFFVAFERAADAVACATAIQRALAEHRRTSGFAPAVRIGVHSGDAEPDGRGFVGAAVHVAARLAARAEGGEVLASEATVREARVAPGGRPEEVRLPGIAEPIAVVPLPW